MWAACVIHTSRAPTKELQQHDVQELNRILFAAIESSLLGTQGQHLIGQLYHGTSVQQVGPYSGEIPF